MTRQLTPSDNLIQEGSCRYTQQSSTAFFFAKMKFIFTCVAMLSVVAVINCAPGGSNLRSTQLRESYLEQLVELIVQEKQANDQV